MYTRKVKGNVLCIFFNCFLTYLYFQRNGSENTPVTFKNYYFTVRLLHDTDQMPVGYLPGVWTRSNLVP